MYYNNTYFTHIRIVHSVSRPSAEPVVQPSTTMEYVVRVAAARQIEWHVSAEMIDDKNAFRTTASTTTTKRTIMISPFVLKLVWVPRRDLNPLPGLRSPDEMSPFCFITLVYNNNLHCRHDPSISSLDENPDKSKCYDITTDVLLFVWGFRFLNRILSFQKSKVRVWRLCFKHYNNIIIVTSR